MDDFFLNWSIWRVDFKYDLIFYLWPHGDLEMTLKRSNLKVVRFGRSFFLNRSIWRVDCRYDLTFDLWPHGDLEMTLKRSNIKVVRFGRSFFFNWSIWRVDNRYDLTFDLWPHGDLKMTLKRSNFTNDSVLRKEKVIKLWHQNGCYFQNGGHFYHWWRRYVCITLINNVCLNMHSLRWDSKRFAFAASSYDVCSFKLFVSMATFFINGISPSPTVSFGKNCKKA